MLLPVQIIFTILSGEHLDIFLYNSIHCKSFDYFIPYPVLPDIPQYPYLFIASFNPCENTENHSLAKGQIISASLPFSYFFVVLILRPPPIPITEWFLFITPKSPSFLKLEIFMILYSSIDEGYMRNVFLA